MTGFEEGQEDVLSDRFVKRSARRRDGHACWALLNRCTSSRNNIVRLVDSHHKSHVRPQTHMGVHLPVSASKLFASSTTARTSAIPESVALSSLNTASVRFASSLASVVLPHLQCQFLRMSHEGLNPL